MSNEELARKMCDRISEAAAYPLPEALSVEAESLVRRLRGESYHREAASIERAIWEKQRDHLSSLRIAQEELARKMCDRISDAAAYPLPEALSVEAESLVRRLRGENYYQEAASIEGAIREKERDHLCDRISEAATYPLPEALSMEAESLVRRLRGESYHREAASIERAIREKERDHLASLRIDQNVPVVALPTPPAPFNWLSWSPVTERDRAIREIGLCIEDYRAGEITPHTPEDIDSWANQFEASAQQHILEAMARVLARTYVSKAKFRSQLYHIVNSRSLAPGVDPVEFWRSANFLWIQRKGESQKNIRKVLAELLTERFGLSLDECGSSDGPYIYFDDCIFTATHVWTDLTNWMKGDTSPSQAKVYVFALATYQGGVNYAKWRVKKEAAALEKLIEIRAWRALRMYHDDVVNGEQSHTFHPCAVPGTMAWREEWERQLGELGKETRLRTTETLAENGVFASECDRLVLEGAFLEAGLRIKYNMCHQLKTNHWPLGFDLYKSPRFNGFGFGATTVTYRNCPNNCPLALWAGDPWKPLFPRRSNPTYQNFDSSIFDDETE